MLKASGVRLPRRRIAVIVLAVVSVLAVTAVPSAAQDPPRQRGPWEFLIASGTVVPTGAQSETITRGNLTTAQVSRRVAPLVLVTGMFGWARSRERAEGDARLDLFVYDAGAELRSPRIGRALVASGFAGLGAGGRSYSRRDGSVDAVHYPAMYASAGGEVGLRRVRVRVEVRDYVARFTSLRGDSRASARNDMAVMVGLRIGGGQ